MAEWGWVTEKRLPVDRGDELDCRARLTALGYTVERAYGALFDEEGVDGWIWYDRHGDEVGSSIGIYEGEMPEIPEQLEAIGMGI